jgi:hypothetical protein
MYSDFENVNEARIVRASYVTTASVLYVVYGLIVQSLSGNMRYDGGDIICASHLIGAFDETLHALLWLVLLNDAH